MESTDDDITYSGKRHCSFLSFQYKLFFDKIVISEIKFRCLAAGAKRTNSPTYPSPPSSPPLLLLSFPPPLLSSSSSPLLLFSSSPLPLQALSRAGSEKKKKKTCFWGLRRRGDRRRHSQFMEHDLCEQVGTLDDTSSGYHGHGLLPFPMLEALVVVQESTDDLLPVLGRLCCHQQLSRSEVLSGSLSCPGPDDGHPLTRPDSIATCEKPGFGPDEEYDGTSGPWRMRKKEAKRPRVEDEPKNSIDMDEELNFRRAKKIDNGSCKNLMNDSQMQL